MVRSRVDETRHADGQVRQLAQTRTVLGRPVYWVNAFWVGGVLIDCGASHARAALMGALENRPVREVYVTHHHEDHVGNAAAVQGRFGATVFASETACRRVEAYEGIPAYRRHAWGEPGLAPMEPAPSRFEAQEHSFQVVPTPGHTRGDLSFVEREQGWAFTGDLVLGVRQVLTRPSEDQRATIQSLEALLRLRPRTVFTGIRVFPQGEAFLRSRIEFLRTTADALERLRRQGLSAVEARRRVLGWEPFMRHWSRGDFAKQHFADQLLEAVEKIPDRSTARGGP